ncbi:hypothetical protein LDENG_00019570 [Lucifuga dentata]|nr:hypothetical protein LDENG_00019570 [Lucifuga dentata]
MRTGANQMSFSRPKGHTLRKNKNHCELCTYLSTLSFENKGDFLGHNLPPQT